MADTSYASCGDLSLAYQLFGHGPVELVYAGSFISHVELFWTMPEFEAFMEKLGGFCRVLLFDKAGVGLSDPVPRVRTLDDRATEIEAVMDAVGFGKAVIFGLSEGGPAAMVFAATRPQRTRALILTGTYAFTGFAGWDDMDRDPAELRAPVVPEMGEDYTPSTEQIARNQKLGRAIRSAWGSGAALKGLLPSVRSIRQLGMLERMSASPGMARATLESAFRIDVRPILPTITAPTLIIHARDDAVPVQGGLARHRGGRKRAQNHIDGVGDRRDHGLRRVGEGCAGRGAGGLRGTADFGGEVHRRHRCLRCGGGRHRVTDEEGGVDMAGGVRPGRGAGGLRSRGA